jgi:hypothetical protein
VGSLQYVKFKCKQLEELVVVPMTNEKAYEQVLARNRSTSASPKVHLCTLCVGRVVN